MSKFNANCTGKRYVETLKISGKIAAAILHFNEVTAVFIFH